MFKNLFRIAMDRNECFCSSCQVGSHEENNAKTSDVAPDSKKAAHPSTTPTTLATVIESLSIVDPDIEALEKRFGELYQGMTITLDIASACELLHKERRRSDTFRVLQKKLASEYGVALRITSRKSRNGSK